MRRPLPLLPLIATAFALAVAHPVRGQQPAPARASYPGDVGPEHTAALNVAASLIRRERYETALRHVRGLNDEDAPAPARAYLEAICLSKLGQPELALQRCEAANRADRTFADGKHLHAQLQAQLGRRQLAANQLRGLLADDPTYGPGYRTLVMLLLELARPREAKRVIGQASARGAEIPDMASLERVLHKALNGPTWRTRFTHRSTHYEVVSDGTPETCALVAEALEDAYAAYKSELGTHHRRTERHRVYVFRNAGDYNTYCVDVLGSAHPHTQGLYSRLLKQLLVLDSTNREQLLATARHEGFHQYLDGVMDDPPCWLNEGLAQYYELPATPNGPVGGRMRPELIAQVDPARALSVPQLFALDRDGFYADAERNYPQSWAVVQFLRNTTESRRRLFRELFREHLRGKVSSSNRRRSQLQALDREFRTWVQELRGVAAPGH